MPIKPETPAGGGRKARNAATARYLNISDMTFWRWKRDARLNFPAPARINNIEWNDLDQIDAWWKSQIVSQLKEIA